jgi:hypothetical protein
MAMDAPDNNGNLTKLDKANWWLFCGPISAWAFTGAWRSVVYEELFMSVVQACDAMKAKSMDLAAREAGREKVRCLNLNITI